LAAFALPLASVSRSRIATGELQGTFDVLDPIGLAAVFLPWLGIVAFSSLRGSATRRRDAAVRGWFASVAVVALVYASGRAAGPALAGVGEFARYSLGPGIWLAGFAAFTITIAARREVGQGTFTGWAVTFAAPAGITLLALAGALDGLGIMVEYRNLGARFWPAVGQHIAYTAAAIVIAGLLGVVLGVVAYRNQKAARPVFALVNAFQTIPGLALMGLLVLPLASLSRAVPGLRELGIGGLGWAPVVLALSLYALLAVVRNTYAGLASVPAATLEAGTGMGMTQRQLLRRVLFPLARPIVFSGVRTASQQTVGNATLGAFVAAGGLGPLIFLGLAQQATDLVLLGSIALVLLALAIDGAMRTVQSLMTPRTTGEVAR
jgi:osmoprotectant transport system permease protein